MKRLSKKLYLGGYLAGSLSGLFLIAVGGLMLLSLEAHQLLIIRGIDDELSTAARITILFLFFGVVLFMATKLIPLVLTYNMWASIQDDHSRTTPGKAVGFLFIPFFNLYWIFQVLPGFAEDYNTYVKNHALAAPEIPVKPFLFYTILLLAQYLFSFFVNDIIRNTLLITMGIVVFVFSIFIIHRVVDAVNTLYKAQGGSTNITV